MDEILKRNLVMVALSLLLSATAAYVSYTLGYSQGKAAGRDAVGGLQDSAAVNQVLGRLIRNGQLDAAPATGQRR